MNATGWAVRVHGLRKSYGGIAAVSGIDLEIAPGEVFLVRAAHQRRHDLVKPGADGRWDTPAPRVPRWARISRDYRLAHVELNG